MKINEEKEMTFEEFVNMVKTEGGEYEIDTPQGWQDIGDIYIKEDKDCYLLRMESGKILGCSDDHLTMTNYGWKKTERLNVKKHKVVTRDGEEDILAKEYLGRRNTYDLEVKSKEHAYYSNDIVSHNSGKSFIIPHIVHKLGLKSTQVAFCAFTGKAAHNLRRRHIPATTIHSLIYTPIVYKDPITGEEKIEFKKLPFLPNCLQLIIVDEASMVTEDIFDDLLSYGVKILCIGDYFQLPPITEDDFNLMREENLNAKLCKIHRQAEDNPIIKLSMRVRAGEHIKLHTGEHVSKIALPELDDKTLLEYNQILCGKNENRRALNDYVRVLMKFHDLPKESERLIILQNNKLLGVFNGQQVILTNDAGIKDKLTLEIEYVDEYDTKDAVKLLLSSKFTQDFSIRPFAHVKKKETEKEMKKKILADFGYAITVHKSQGSEWESVILYDDKFGIWDADMRTRWLYTAITRATDRFIWVVS